MVQAVKVARSIDLFAVEQKPSSIIGVVISVMVLAATVTYSAILAFQLVHQAPATTNVIDWTMGAQPQAFPMKVTCVALSGCMLSNAYGAAAGELALVTAGTAGGLLAGEKCVRLAVNETAVVHLNWSNDPYDGLVVVFDPASTAPPHPAGAGVSVISASRCLYSAGCMEGVMWMSLLVGPGLTLAHYVRTVNSTEPESWAGRRREEWFLSRVAEGGALAAAGGAGARPWCFGNATEPGAVGPGAQQARISLQPFWNQINVEKESFWLALWGTCGGAFSTFLQVGTAVVVACSFLAGHFASSPSTAAAGTAAAGHQQQGAAEESPGGGDGGCQTGVATADLGGGAGGGKARGGFVGAVHSAAAGERTAAGKGGGGGGTEAGGADVLGGKDALYRPRSALLMAMSDGSGRFSRPRSPAHSPRSSASVLPSSSIATISAIAPSVTGSGRGTEAWGWDDAGSSGSRSPSHLRLLAGMPSSEGATPVGGRDAAQVSRFNADAKTPRS
ncbi:hypothetical protein CHLRE_06g308200v5 [Chlamydomonas reinhardtii]|uniref:Uncharacterized protein n=1 Tax=Chlamydomonas reinhardtii TaxID=3055 RepID=A0A2K3DRJ9_CHLRE|nr:uncharacterized protein CHLRE_06g308200v5 [Chlamydomonas reinhardtii]PNW83137.1 hypothetical protein CHLRE_06g308200v5 [Chlamydomonas reinhardtii]